jgi:hypothetical protein
LLAEGDQVVARFTMSGTNTGDYRGLPAPTQQHFESEAIAILRIADGRVTELQGTADRLAMLTQLGILPDIGCVRTPPSTQQEEQSVYPRPALQGLGCRVKDAQAELASGFWAGEDPGMPIVPRSAAQHRASLAFLLDNQVLRVVGVVLVVVYTFGNAAAWWIPYLVRATASQRREYQKSFSRTMKSLPPIGDP